LTQDETGMTSFRIEYTIGDDREKRGAIKKILSKLRLIKETGDVTTSYEYEGNSSSEYQYQKIDLAKSLKNNLTFTVKIKDLKSGITVAKKLEFSME
jgi:hypothetical protein